MRSRALGGACLLGFFLCFLPSGGAQNLKSLIHAQKGRSFRASSGNRLENQDAVRLGKGESNTIAVQCRDRETSPTSG